MKKIFAAIFILFFLTLLAGCAPTLHSAVKNNDIEKVRALLKEGADVNERDQWGPALHEAAANGRSDIIRMLLDAGADINSRDYWGGTALQWAAFKGPIENVKLLLDKGADVNSADKNGVTPLVSAAEGKHADIIKFLISKGADVDAAIWTAERLAVKGPQSNWPVYSKFLAKYASKQEGGRTAPAVSIANNEAQSVPVIKSDIDEPPAIMSEPRKNAYAVVIGIENYRSLPKSDYSRNDAALVKAYLKSLGFQERNIDFITDEKATKTDIEKSLEAWLPNRAEKHSLIVVYFSGHGAPEPSTGEAYIVPYDGDPNYLPVTGYSLKRLYERLGKLEAKEIVVVLDSCFSGSGGRSVLAKGARPLVMMTETTILASNMAILTATQGSQISTSSPEKGHGIFTYYFLKAIKDGKRNLAEIYEYIKPQVEDEAKQINVQQSPSLNPGVEKVKGRFSLRK